MKILKRVACLAKGHDWKLVRVNTLANLHLGHLHSLAGCDAICRRCGSWWEDFHNFCRYPWVTSEEMEEIERKARRKAQGGDGG